jgi:hypothetical protein
MADNSELAIILSAIFGVFFLVALGSAYLQRASDLYRLYRETDRLR